MTDGPNDSRTFDRRAPMEPREPDWSRWKPTVRATLLFIRDGGRILLMRKKRGLGAGKINAPGGKIDPGETALDCALRETFEELRVTARDPEPMGELHFQFVDGLRMHVTVFLAHAFEGEPVETEEAAPRWTPVDALPFDEMWADDRFWLEPMLAGRRFAGFFVFDDDRMLAHRTVFDDEADTPHPAGRSATIHRAP